MTVPLRSCATCAAPLPSGALYCRVCGTSAPTEIGRGAELMLRGVGDVDDRKADLQRALGKGFEVRQLVGRGGFGEVWAAFDVELARDIAVKVLRPELAASGEFRERFRREARAVARLRHPGIVPIYHVGEAQGLVYFIMPLVQGTTLTGALRSDGGLSAAETKRILTEAAAALREAHSHGIIHRDLKPENFMLEGPQRRVLLMDFGIAKVDGPSKEGLTDTGIVLGSPEYMSPEQATGRSMDARSDIYSLGVVAYRMLAGRLPFNAETPREVLAHHVLTPPLPLADELAVPPGLANAVMRCLAKSPDDRWQTTDQFLDAISAEVPIFVPPPSSVTPTRDELPAVVAPSHLDRRRWSRAAGVLALAGLLGMAALATWLRGRALEQRRWTAAGDGIAALYRESADSLRVVSRAFGLGDTTAAQYLAIQDSLLAQAEARIDEVYGVELDDSAHWPEPARMAVRTAQGQLASAALAAGRHRLLPGEVAGCRLVAAGDSTVARDAQPDDNCWWALADNVRLSAPVEFLLDFRVPERLPADAGLGLAWCAHAADCRVVFVWASNAVVWASHQPREGLQPLQMGRRAALDPGEHRLRVREQDGNATVWLDDRVVLVRQVSREVAYIERPGSLNVVVQNATIILRGVEPLGVVGNPRPDFERP